MMEFLINLADYPTIMGFEPLINQRLLPPTFPRYTVIRSRAESLGYITSLLQRLHTVTMVTELTSLHAALVILNWLFWFYSLHWKLVICFYLSKFDQQKIIKFKWTLWIRDTTKMWLLLAGNTVWPPPYVVYGTFCVSMEGEAWGGGG